MNEELRSVHIHMQEFGLCALAHANRHASYYSMENKAWSQLSVTQAAHAAEILIKARIAQEHPLLIFESLPKSNKKLEKNLDFNDLFENGRTYQFSDLPERLWAATGILLPNVELYQSFGKLRNSIQHFTFPKDRDLSQDTLEFVFGVIDPFINACWGDFAVDYDEDHEPYVYFLPTLIAREVLFLVSEDLISNLSDDDIFHIDMNWPKRDNSYSKEMRERIAEARLKFKNDSQ